MTVKYLLSAFTCVSNFGKIINAENNYTTMLSNLKSLRIGNTSKSVAQAHLWQVTPVDTDSSCTRSAFSSAFYSSAHIAPAILLAKLALSVRLYPAFIHFSTPRYHCARAFI